MHHLHPLPIPLFSGILLAAAFLPTPGAGGGDWIIHSGETVIYDTANGSVRVDRLEIQSGGTLGIVGRARFELHAVREILVAGTLDLSGNDSRGVLTLNTTNISEPGASGSAGGGQGGLGNRFTTQSTPAGGPGFGSEQEQALGGGGGETSYSQDGTESRRAAGGGGGAFGPDRPFESASSAIGLVAESGWDGGPNGKGALTNQSPARGGASGPRPFVDGDPSNDFFGRKRTSAGTLRGELDRPQAGTGGGAGGNAVNFASFPLIPFDPTGDEKGAGGGGGGGLGILISRRIVLLPGGGIVADGGSGGPGENPSSGGFSHVGGGSGGGSGGQLLLQAGVFDFSAADAGAIRAIGGQGAPGRFDYYDEIGAGGDGGPGLIQLHTRDGGTASILLPLGVALEDVTLPDAHVLLPEASF